MPTGSSSLEISPCVRGVFIQHPGKKRAYIQRDAGPRRQTSQATSRPETDVHSAVGRWGEFSSAPC